MFQDRVGRFMNQRPDVMRIFLLGASPRGLPVVNSPFFRFELPFACREVRRRDAHITLQPANERWSVHPHLTVQTGGLTPAGTDSFPFLFRVVGHWLHLRFAAAPVGEALAIFEACIRGHSRVDLRNQARRHLSGAPPLVWRTRSTCGRVPGLSSRARSIAACCVGKTSLARSELARRTAKSPCGRFST
jgi:hypothetical protein